MCTCIIAPIVHARRGRPRERRTLEENGAISSAPITEAAALAAAASELSRHAVIGIDTEFMRERTYYAQLCLVQLAVDGLALCADPLSLPSLEPLRPLIGAPHRCKVMHAARQDLEVLAPAVGALTNLFDTQVAAALVGYPAQVGYADLLRDALGVDLHKSQTRTDWSRPTAASSAPRWSGPSRLLSHW